MLLVVQVYVDDRIDDMDVVHVHAAPMACLVKHMVKMQYSLVDGVVDCNKTMECFEHSHLL